MKISVLTEMLNLGFVTVSIAELIICTNVFITIAHWYQNTISFKHIIIF